MTAPSSNIKQGIPDSSKFADLTTGFYEACRFILW